jgi:hypothetical protein
MMYISLHGQVETSNIPYLVIGDTGPTRTKPRSHQNNLTNDLSCFTPSHIAQRGRFTVLVAVASKEHVVVVRM